MQLIVSIIVLFLGIYTFFAPRATKMKILLFSTLCLNFASFSFVSFGTAAKIVTLFFFLSELKHTREFFAYLKNTPFITILWVMSAAAIIHIFTSPHINNLVTVLGFIVNDLIAKYFVIAYVFVYFQRNKDLFSFVHIAYLSLLIITGVGVISLITRTDPIALFSLSETGDRFINHESRQRIVSLFIYPFDYGYASLMLLLFMMYAKFNNLLDSRRFYIALGCAVFGIIFCGCRTVLVTSIISLGIFFFFHYCLMRFGWYILLGVVALIGGYSFSPKFQKTIDVTLTAFDPEAKMEKGGSSTLKDRTLQYITTYDYARKNIWIGRGYRFFENDLGYNKNGDGLYSLHGKARNLLGLEGVMMRLLLERGIIGILSYILFYVLLFKYLARLKNYSNLDASFGIATLVAFICFGNMTGELGSAIITFLFAGIYIKSAAEIECTQVYDDNIHHYNIEYAKTTYNNTHHDVVPTNTISDIDN